MHKSKPYERVNIKITVEEETTEEKIEDDKRTKTINIKRMLYVINVKS